MRIFLLLAICIVMASCADRSVVYTPDHWPEKIHGSVFKPKTNKPAPAVLLIHGGVKLGQDGRWVMNRTAEKLRKRGYYVLSITYRSLSKWTYPSQLRDVRMALKWMYENAEAEGIDPDRLAVFGYSAGGYLGALAALDKREGDLAVKAIVAGGTPTDLTVYARGKLIRHYLGGGNEPFPDQFEEASPLTYITDDSPPFFIYHGTTDKLVRPEHPLALMEKLREHHVAHQIFWIEGKGHVGTFFSSGEAVEKAIDFLDRELSIPNSGVFFNHDSTGTGNIINFAGATVKM